LRTLKPILLLLSCLAVSLAQAADIVRDVSSGRTDEDVNGGYFELGFSAGYLDRSFLNNEIAEQNGGFLGLAVGGAYRYKKFFIEASQGTLDGLNTGYTFYSDQNFEFDFIFSSINGNIDTELDEADDVLRYGTEADRNEYLLARETLYSGMGLRATAYYDDYVLQLRLLEDVYDNAGFTSTLRLGRAWLVKNWNFHSIIGAEYASANTHHYLYGVDQAFATEMFPEYSPKSGFSLVGEIGTTYPLSKNWVYRSIVRFRHLSEQIQNSPLTDGGHTDTIFYNSISYVF